MVESGRYWRQKRMFKCSFYFVFFINYVHNWFVKFTPGDCQRHVEKVGGREDWDDQEDVGYREVAEQHGRRVRHAQGALWKASFRKPKYLKSKCSKHWCPKCPKPVLDFFYWFRTFCTSAKFSMCFQGPMLLFLKYIFRQKNVIS
jgi:hypothetical protein